MDVFIKIIAGILIGVILSLVLAKSGKDAAMLLSISVLCMTAACAMRYLEPVISFFRQLEITGNLEPRILKILLKAVGIGLLAEITELICNDSGNQALGKALQIAATAFILWLSIPLLEQLLTLLDTILGNL